MAANPSSYASFDDSLSGKDKDTHALEGVDWRYDHTASSKKTPRYRNGLVHVSCRVQLGEYGYTLGWRLYLRAKTIRRLNRQRAKSQRLSFKSKYALATMSHC